MNACVGAFDAASVGVGIGSVPIGGISIFGGTIVGESGPFTQQHAGRRSNNRRTDAVVVKIAIGFHGVVRDIYRMGFHKRCRGATSGKAVSRGDAGGKQKNLRGFRVSA